MRMIAYCNDSVVICIVCKQAVVGTSTLRWTCGMPGHPWTCVYVQCVSLWCVCAAIPIVIVIGTDGIGLVSALIFTIQPGEFTIRPGDFTIFFRDENDVMQTF